MLILRVATHICDDWVKVIGNPEHQNVRNSDHSYQQWHDGDEPVLELLMTSRHEHDTAHVLDQYHLTSESYVKLSLHSEVFHFLGVESVQKVRKTSRERVLSDEEVPNVAE
jgi:hypothetical protein